MRTMARITRAATEWAVTAAAEDVAVAGEPSKLSEGAAFRFLPNLPTMAAT